jgi:hypothetical protein
VEGQFKIPFRGGLPLCAQDKQDDTITGVEWAVFNPELGSYERRVPETSKYTYFQFVGASTDRLPSNLSESIALRVHVCAMYPRETAC